MGTFYAIYKLNSSESIPRTNDTFIFLNLDDTHKLLVIQNASLLNFLKLKNYNVLGIRHAFNKYVSLSLGPEIKWEKCRGHSSFIIPDLSPPLLAKEP